MNLRSNWSRKSFFSAQKIWEETSVKREDLCAKEKCRENFGNCTWFTTCIPFQFCKNFPLEVQKQIREKVHYRCVSFKFHWNLEFIPSFLWTWKADGIVLKLNGIFTGFRIIKLRLCDHKVKYCLWLRLSQFKSRFSSLWKLSNVGLGRLRQLFNNLWHK